MADLTTFAMAEDRAKAQVEAGTWVVAYACRGENASLYSVRFIRPMTTAFTQGGWAEATDNTTD